MWHNPCRRGQWYHLTDKEAFIHSRDGGVGKVLLAVNKLDLVDYSRRFSMKSEDFKDFCESALSLSEVRQCQYPSSGVNVVDHSDKTPWYTGKTVMNYLETVEVSKDDEQALQNAHSMGQ